MNSLFYIVICLYYSISSEAFFYSLDRPKASMQVNFQNDNYKTNMNTYLEAKKKKKETDSRTIENPWSALDVVEGSGSPDISENVRAGLKAELASPFRGLRLFFYSAMGVAAGLGLVTSIPQLIIAFGDTVMEKDIPLQTALTNLGVNSAGVISAIFLLIQENKSQSDKKSKFQEKEMESSNKLSSEEIERRESQLSLLPVEIQVSETNENVTRIVSVGDLQKKGRQNIIIFAGKLNIVKDALISGKIEGNSFFNSKETFIIPVVLEGNNKEKFQDASGRSLLGEQIEESPTKGFGSAKEGLMTGPYIGKPTQLGVWEAYLQKEVDLAKAQGAKDVEQQGLAIAVNLKGKVIRRGLGIPPWQQIVEDLEKSNISK